MAKLNKSEAENVAKTWARTNPLVANRTLDEINAMSYDERRRLARSYADEVAPRVDTKYVDAFKMAYEDAAMSVWGSKVKQHENARRSFKLAAAGITVEQAVDKVVALVTSMNIRGASVDRNRVEVNRDGSRWGGPSLSWTFDRNYDDALVDPDNADRRVYRYTFKLSFSTSGSNYSAAEMGMLHKIHSELMGAANEIEVNMRNENVIHKYGFSEEVVEPVIEPSTELTTRRLTATDAATADRCDEHDPANV